MSDLEKPDLKNGAPSTSISDGGKLIGTVDGEEVLLVRRGTEFFAALRLVSPTSLKSLEFMRHFDHLYGAVRNTTRKDKTTPLFRGSTLYHKKQ